MAFRRSLAEQDRGSRDAEEQLQAALAASLEVWAPAIILSSPEGCVWLMRVAGLGRAELEQRRSCPVNVKLLGSSN